jgi:hypothetical protein
MDCAFIKTAPIVLGNFSPAFLFANAGTPLMWAGILHLLFGNLLIGIGEGVLLAMLFRGKVPVSRAIIVMVIANYFSAWVGAFLVGIAGSLPSLDLYNAWAWLWIMVGASYLATLLLEWPFVALCLRKLTGWFPKSILGTLATQSASYLFIFGWYWLASRNSLFTELTIVPPTQMNLPGNTRLYYISEEDGDVYGADLDGRETNKIHELGSTDTNDRLCVMKSSVTDGLWSLAAVLQTDDFNQPQVKTVMADFASISEAVLSRGDSKEFPDDTWMNFGEVPQLPSEYKNNWHYWTGFWPAQGMHCNNIKNGESFNCALETPFVKWVIRNATQLPTGQVVFQLGKEQICILDPDEKKIALLVKGRGPVVVIKESRKANIPIPTEPSPSASVPSPLAPNP